MALQNTHFGVSRISSLLEGGAKNVYFVGIGGISMCSLAYITALRGHRVAGYDRTPSHITEELTAAGIPVHYENDCAHVKEADIVVYTVAIPADTPEYADAMARGVPCISRADYLGYVMSAYTHRIGVSGMHGKSTTTAMLEKIFVTGGADPTVNCGAAMNDTGRAYRIGRGDTFIFEACEYMDSFLQFCPTTAVILNIEMDHVDYFKSMEQIRRSFRAFADRTGASGQAVVNADDEDVMKAVSGYGGRLITFSALGGNADYSAANIRHNGCHEHFDIIHGGELLCTIELSVPGEHSICDALAAAAAAHSCGISPKMIADGLRKYAGASRRMEFVGTTDGGAAVYSDYAHHPTEIRTTLAGAAEMEHNRLICVFQSHTYSRTKELFSDFVDAFAAGSEDLFISAPIYPARETDTLGVSGSLLAERIAERGKATRSFDSFKEIAEYVSAEAKEGDMVLIMGAGDVDAVAGTLTGKKR
jgi:UDP-N-acetylmuramate--alanine ligase